MPFNVQRGTNISHWLSQSKQRGQQRRAFFTQADVARLADWGFDHVRLPIDEEQMWDERGRPEPEAFGLLDAALDWCRAAGLRVIVDLHILRSHYFMDASPPLFTDVKQAEKFADLWRQLSEHLRAWPNDRMAYELMNEPVAQDDEDWNRVYEYPYRALRRLEPDRTIVLGSNRWSQCKTFDVLRVPENDPNLILTFHFYNPMLITHYKAGWSDAGKYTGPVRYPGIQVTPEYYAGLAPDVKAVVDKYNRPYGPEAMVDDLQKPLAVRKCTGLPLYCGEFGAINHTPDVCRFPWYRDLIGVFRQFGVAWANWDYKGGFGLVDGSGRSTGVAEVMLASASRPRPEA